MKIHPAEQGSLEWLTARAGVITASEMDNIMTPEFEPRKGEMPKTYMAVKLAEKWLGGPLPSFTSIDTEFGSILEDLAIPFYELETGETLTRVGLCLTDGGAIGASPDALIDEDSGIEIKCPRAETHVKYLLAGVVPKDYLVQIHSSLYVTGRASWKFMSFHRRFPPLILTVQRDDKIQSQIAEALAPFMALFDTSWKRLCEINGGPPKRAPAPKQPEPAPEVFDYRH